MVAAAQGAPASRGGTTMQVMLLIYNDEAAWDAMPEAERMACFGAYHAYSAALRDAGAMVAGDPLQPSAAAQTVTTRGGAPVVLDGPYAETKEQLGGYYLIEVPDMEAAMRWAARCPGAALGTIEVRPLLPMPAVAAPA
jgi:hypothetical protein